MMSAGVPGVFKFLPQVFDGIQMSINSTQIAANSLLFCISSWPSMSSATILFSKMADSCTEVLRKMLGFFRFPLNEVA